MINKILTGIGGFRNSFAISFVFLLTHLAPTADGAALVATGQYDNYRDGANLNETILNTFNVAPSTFGRIGSFAVDGEVRAQPLYVPGVNIRGTLTNVLFVATMHNSVFAFDATRPGSLPLWKTNFAPSVPAFYASTKCPNTANTGPEIGILGTPVIDTVQGILYAVYTTTSGPNSYVFNIAALDITTGLNKAGSPSLINASVPGTGYDSVGGVVSLNQKTYIQRPALALSNGSVYAGFSSCGPDPDPYHGWMLGFSASNVSVQTSVYNSTPNGSEGAIWQGGRGLVVDGSGNIYASTGNGTNATGCSNLSSCDVSDSVVKFSPSGLPTGVYTDPDAATLSQFDLDLSSSGPLYVGSTGMVLAGGKEGILHVLNAASFGGSNTAVQSFVATKACGTFTVGGCFHVASLVYWDNPINPLLYVWANSDVMRVYRWNGTQFNTTADATGPLGSSYPGGNMALSANGSNVSSGVLWATTPDNVLHAFPAANITSELYNTNQNSARDATGTISRYVVPMVADGRVYVSTLNGQVQVYGLLGTTTQATASFVKRDSTTQGNWSTGYGADGYNVIGDLSANPPYAAPGASGQSFWTWTTSTTDVRALQKPSNAADRVVAGWYSGSSFLIHTNITDNTSHQVALYCLDWDSTGRRQTIDVLDSNGNVLNTQALTTSFNGGVYLVWNVTGPVVFRITWTGGFNGVVEGIFFGAGVSRTVLASATFSKLDATTQGAWTRGYGAEGYNVVGDTALNPAYAAPATSGQSTWTWATSTTDTRALQKASAPSDHVAATWYSASSFLIDTNITDTNPHQVALYCLDWDSTVRRQTIDVLDTNGNVLNTQALTTSYNGGVYLVWNVTGHVIFRVTWNGGANAVVQGLFFGGPRQTGSASAIFARLDTTTQGNWRTGYGADGYNVVGNTFANPAYAAPVMTGASTWVWASSTTDIRALQKSNASDRVAAAWNSVGSFLIDTQITDANQHQVALYCLDWDTAARQQTVDVLDTAGNVLDSRTLSTSFNGGVYLVWNVTGHVIFRVTWKGGFNAVVQGMFFGGPSSQTTRVATATFLKTDTAAQGNWEPFYGVDGWAVVGDTTSNPVYAAPVASGESPWVWAVSTADVRALQKASNPTDRVSAAWFSLTPFTVDTNITDSSTHQVEIYCLDWDSTARRQTIDVLDANGNVLNTQALTTNFNGGVYLVWNVTGHVTFRVTSTAGANAVVQGVFFGGP